jgi:MFS transporter, ACS family, glucarate transporter
MSKSQPSIARYRLVAWLCALAGVLYLDRSCMGQAIKPIQDELGLTDLQVGYVHMAFTLAYGLFEVPTGRMGDQYGPRKVLVRIVLWWSLFTALTGACSTLWMLLTVRFLFGAGEAGAFPNTAVVYSRWIPIQERGRVQGIVLAAAQVGFVLAPTVAAWFIDRVGWRWMFVLFGGVGVLWAMGFAWWFRDDPAKHPGVDPEELQLIQAGRGPQKTEHDLVPWGLVLTNSGILLLGLLMAVMSFQSYFYISWFTKYLQSGRGLGNQLAGYHTSLVMFGAATGVFAGGWLASAITASSDPVRWRRIAGVACGLIAAAVLWFVPGCENTWVLASLAGVSCFFMNAMQPTWWSCAIEQSGRHVGSLFGLMNMMGVVGAMSSQWFVGWFADHQKSLGLTGRMQWDPVLYAYMGCLLVFAACWTLYHRRPLATDPVFDASPQAGEPAAAHG